MSNLNTDKENKNKKAIAIQINGLFCFCPSLFLN